MKAILVTITGRDTLPVQGVWYRESCKNAAEEAGVKGWIKNLSDGRVQAFFFGEEEQVDAMIGWCMNFHGRATPLELDVEDMDLDHLDSPPQDFVVIH
ncbi:MAG: acylphosphatase [Candidatus Magasanikbacteria bacterium]|nr:acylphosphatase [Candidatus Magasanikbacteria bacterium]